MHDPHVVNRRQPGCHRARVGQPIGERPPIHLPGHDLISQRSAGRQLHHQEDASVGLFEVEHAADVRVLDLPRQLHLASQPLAPDPLPRVLRAQDLDRDRLIQRPVLRPDDDPHPPTPDDALDGVAPGENLPRANWSDLGDLDRGHTLGRGHPLVARSSV
jgi:hypothetical protein